MKSNGDREKKHQTCQSMQASIARREGKIDEEILDRQKEEEKGTAREWRSEPNGSCLSRSLPISTLGRISAY